MLRRLYMEQSKISPTLHTRFWLEAHPLSMLRVLRRILSPTQVRGISRVLNAWRQRKAIRRWRKFSRLSNRRFHVPVKRWDIPSREATRAR